jgi:hypothetical protein
MQTATGEPMQTTPPAPQGATSFALPITFAELLDLDEQAREIAACTPWTVEQALDVLRMRLMFMPERSWTELLERGDEAWAFVNSIAGDL